MRLILLTVSLALISGTLVADEEKPAPPKGPESFQVKLETSKGDIVLQITRSWSPIGADRFHQLVKAGFYSDCRFFRVIEGFMAQTGVNGDPKLHAAWKDKTIQDDPLVKSNKRGFVSFAKSGLPNSRSTQFFISFQDNSYLDEYKFSPFAQVVKGMEVVDMIYSGYGEGAPRGNGPPQSRVVKEGNEYLKANYPKLDYIKKATIVPAK